MNREAAMAKLMNDWHNAIGKEHSFNADGIVDPAVWDQQKAGKKILFILKETNGLKDIDGKKDVSLVEWLMTPEAPGHYGGLWPRIAEWWCAICHEEEAYRWQTVQMAQESLKKVAVMNLKKAPGGAQAKEEEIVQHIEEHWEFIQKEIELIDPDIIVFCGTWWMIRQVHQEYKNTISETYFAKAAFPTSDSKTRLLINFWHPAARYPAVVMYYGIQGIYRASQAKKEALATSNEPQT